MSGSGGGAGIKSEVLIRHSRVRKGVWGDRLPFRLARNEATVARREPKTGHFNKARQ